MSNKKTVRELRLEQGLSQWQLAVKVGCRPETISDIERRVKGTSLQVAVSICKALGVDPNNVDIVVKKQTGQHKWTVVEDPFISAE
jgi:DNA-binding XRE family transcriptional regulator